MPTTKFENVSGTAQNALVHRHIKNVAFSANMYSRPKAGVLFRWKNTGHAMLSLMQPGDYVPKLAGSYVPVELNHVHVLPAYRGCGHATVLVGRCLQYARRKQWTVVLRAIAYGNPRDKPPTVSDLISWYVGMGFTLVEKTDGISYMRLTP